MDKQFILVAIRETHTQIVFGPALARLCGYKKTELIKSGNWKGWILKIQYEHRKTKLKTFEEKIASIKI